jgi:hypothetical protein
VAAGGGIGGTSRTTQPKTGGGYERRGGPGRARRPTVSPHVRTLGIDGARPWICVDFQYPRQDLNLQPSGPQPQSCTDQRTCSIPAKTEYCQAQRSYAALRLNESSASNART